MARQYKRRKLIVDASFQFGFIVKFALIVVVSTLVIGPILFLLTRNSTTVAIENTRIFAKPTSDFIFPVLCLTVLCVTLVAALVVVITTLFVSHRIAGPVFRLKREVNLFAGGQLKRNFIVRQKDGLKDLARCLQEMADVYCLRLRKVKKDSDLLATLLHQESIKEDLANRDKIKKVVEDIRNNIEYFKV